MRHDFDMAILLKAIAGLNRRGISLAGPHSIWPIRGTCIGWNEL